MFPEDIREAASKALEAAKSAGIRIATAETCTAGLVSAALTSVPGASEVFDRGYVLYHASAKSTSLGVSEDVAQAHGAVSAEVTKGLAEGALAQSGAGVAVAITGYAGPGGGSERDPVGTVYIACARDGCEPVVERLRFEGGRDDVRMAAVKAALDLLTRVS